MAIQSETTPRTNSEASVCNRNEGTGFDTIEFDPYETIAFDGRRLVSVLLEGLFSQDLVEIPAGSKFLVGRGDSVHLRFPTDMELSRQHFTIEFDDESVVLRDLQSTNGTRVNGKRIEETRLFDGDFINAGALAVRVSFLFSDGNGPPA